MSTYLGKSCSFDVQCVLCQIFVSFCARASFPPSFEGEMWDLIVSIS